jgi:hypothetical protein
LIAGTEGDDVVVPAVLAHSLSIAVSTQNNESQRAEIRPSVSVRSQVAVFLQRLLDHIWYQFAKWKWLSLRTATLAHRDCCFLVGMLTLLNHDPTVVV